MTTFTTEDRERASKLVEEAPYHPGYEDAIVDNHVNNWIVEHLEYRNRHLDTAKKIIEFIKSENVKRR
jgi:hypothetical protein